MDLSVEEANKIRVAMGMKPLPVPGGNNNSGPIFKEAKTEGADDDEPASTLETRAAEGYENWQRIQDEAKAKAKRDAQKEAIRKAREKAARFALLEGKGLADEADETDDKAWLQGSKKRQKKIEKSLKLQQELEERERQAEAARQYTEKDLAGVKVGHELDDFGEGDEVIVHLKDTAVDAEDDDELEAVELKERENLKDKLDSKKRKRAYDPNDMDEGGQGSILAQYDEEIDGKKRKVFTLDGQGKTVEGASIVSSTTSKPKKMAISLDILKEDTPANDYLEFTEVKVKKPKKKKSKSTRKKAVADDDVFPLPDASADVEMEDDGAITAPAKQKKSMFDESFIDDDDLQANLAQQRREALKKRKKMRPEDLAKQLREEASATPDIMETSEDFEEPGLVIDETSEFVANLQKPITQESRRSRSTSRVPNGTMSMGAPSPAADEDGDADMKQSYNEVEDEEERKERTTRSASAEITATGLEDEATLNKGVGSVLALLKHRGMVEESNSGDLNKYYRERQQFLADKEKAESTAERQAREQREKDRRSGRLDRMTPREREEYARRMNANRDQLESRKLADIFNKEYKPNVQLNYVDEFGRQMNAKEAFKQLSHQFHGKGSGNTKTQKHLDKIEAEKKRMAQSTLDTSQNTGMSNAQGVQSKKHKQAGVRLQ